jgi:hypothetical protein
MVRLEGLGQLKKSNDLIRIRSRDLPACSIVPQPTTLPRAHVAGAIKMLKKTVTLSEIGTKYYSGQTVGKNSYTSVRQGCTVQNGMYGHPTFNSLKDEAGPNNT